MSAIRLSVLATPAACKHTSQRSTSTIRIDPMKWLWQGVLSVDIPEGWNVHEQADVIEITPPEPIGAAHITVLRRTKQDEVEQGEAAVLARDFARKQGATANPSEVHGEDQLISHASFETVSEEGRLLWDLETRVWKDGALISSFCHDGTHQEERQAALRMFRSITPVVDRALPYRM